MLYQCILLFWFLILQRLRMTLLIRALYQICIIILFLLPLLIISVGLLKEHSFRMLKEHYFAGHHMGNYAVTSYIHCLTLCLAQYSCLSANVRISGPITDNCVLNNATLWEDRDAMMTNVTDYVDPRDWIYYEVEYPAFRM